MNLIPREVVLGTRLLRSWLRRRDSQAFDVIKAKLFITRRCNLSCLHCGIGRARYDATGELTTDQVVSLWHSNPELQILSLSGGEPFLRDDLAEIVTAAVNLLPRLMVLTINTNGWFTDRTVRLAETVAPLMPPRCRLVVACSSDGPREAHADIRQNDESFIRKERTLDGLRRLAAGHPNLEIRHNVNVNRWNLCSIGEYVHRLSTSGEQCFISMYSASKHYSHGPADYVELEAFRREVARHPEIFRQLARSSDLLGRLYLAFASAYYGSPEPVQPLPCFSLRSSLIIEHDGMVRPCINFPRDLGYIQDHGFSLRDVVSSPACDALRRDIGCGKCPVCWTPNEAYTTLMCNFFNPSLLKRLPGRFFGG